MAGNFIFGWNYIFLRITFVWFYRRTGGFSVIVAYGILIAFSGICTLHLFLWRVKVNHDVIEYRSFFGKKYYKFSDITRSVHKENGTLEIYAGDKIIFKFDENISASLFANSLSKHKISQETWLSCRDKKCIIRPKESHYVLPGIFFLYLVYNSVILVFNAKETAFVFLLFSLVPGGIFFYFLIKKARETRDRFQSIVGKPYNYVYEEYNEITTLTCSGNKYKAI